MSVRSSYMYWYINISRSHKDSCTYNRIHKDHLDELLTEWLKICPTVTQWDACHKIAREFEEKRVAELGVRIEVSVCRNVQELNLIALS